MAYGAGIFLPSETAYKDPGRFADVLKAEGSKQAAYLANMDQFFAQLEEMKRQFDVTAEMKERFFEEEMAFKTEELEFRGEESELDRALRRWEVGETTGLGYAELETRRGAQAETAGLERERLGLAREQVGLEGERLGLERRESEFLRGIYGATERRTQETHETAKRLITGGGAAEPSFYDVGPSAYDPYAEEGFASWLERQ